MIRFTTRLVVVGLCVLSTAVLVRAASVTFWTVATQAEFLKGDADHLSIDIDGRLALGPAIEQLTETSAPFLWTVIPARDGGFFAGSGNEGKVYRIGRDGKSSAIFDSDELEVHALAPAPDGGVYVATSPDGKVYKIAADGKSSVVFDPEDKYIWSLAVDQKGVLYIATGEKGVIYRVGPDGKGAPFYKTRATHALVLAFDRDGNLLAGTGSPGRVFRIDSTGKGFVLLDSPYREIRAIRVAADGTLYAAALSDRPSTSENRPGETVAVEPQRTATPSVSTEITGITIVDTGQASAAVTSSAAREARAKQAKGAVYRIKPDGFSDVVWDSDVDTPYDLAVEPQGRILVATGSEGRVYEVTPDAVNATLVGRVGAQQITSVLANGDGQYVFSTANPGKLYRLSAARSARGTYESDVRDATTVASWGAISWRAQLNGGQIEISTRTGNTATPDETWSEWSPPYKNVDGEQIVSPKARYLQWRAILAGARGGESPVLTSVTAAYLPRNLRPEIDSITVHPPGTVFQKPFSTGEFEIAGFEDKPNDPPQTTPQPGQTTAPLLGRRMYQKGLQTFVWKASDPNDDRLQYDVLFRREGESQWKVLRRDVTDPLVVWDTTMVPDGSYVVKIVASDAPSNSPSTALTGERESASFDVDNTPPHIVLTPRDNTPVLRFTVRDDHSPVQKVEYSIEGDRWRVIYPVDGIADSRVEQFELKLGSATAGTLTIRAGDAMNNVATVAVDLKR